MKWVRLTKYFQGGLKIDYMFVEDERLEDDDNQKELTKEWGENSDGGHAYGYRVELEVLEGDEIPPQEWLEKKKKSLKTELAYIHKAIGRTEELIKTLELLLK